MPIFPHTEEIEYLEGKSLNYLKILEFLSPQLTDNRKVKIDKVLRKRTYSIIPVLEKIWDQGNINAVLRSAESFGMQHIHIIEAEKYKKANRVSKGAHKWLDFTYYKSTADCISDLKKNNYQILVTHLSDTAVPIDQCDFSKPTAFVLGSEGSGASEEMLELADQHIIIPMQGFTQSFNISVAAAISFYHMYTDKLKRLGKFGDMQKTQLEILRAIYYLRSVPNANEKLDFLSKR